jgi:hypothetical protein
MSNPTYHYKESAITQETTLSFDQTTLTLQREEASNTIALGDIEHVHLKYDPTRLQPNRYTMTIKRVNQTPLRIVNTHYQGIANFADQSPQYVPFAQALHQAIAKQSSNTRFTAGSSLTGYVFSVIALVFAMLVLVAATLYLLATGLFLVVLIKLIVIIIYTPMAWRYIKRNKPSEYDPTDIPSTLLPQLEK